MAASFETVTPAHVRDLVAGPPGLRVSLYLPISDATGAADGRLNDAYRAAVREASSRMSALGVDEGKARETARRLQQQPPERSSLPAATRAIGVLLGPGGVRPFAMTRPVEASVQIGRTFHLRPLLASAHLDCAYRVVSLIDDSVELFEGDSWGLRGIDVSSLASKAGHALGSDLRSGGLELLASALSRAWSGDSEPIVLVAADRALAARFRELADLPGLLDEGLNGEAQVRSPAALHDGAFGIVRGWIGDCDRTTLEETRAALSLGRATEELRTAAEVAATGGVSTVFVAPAARVAKHIDAATGALLDSLGDEDALDELCALVIARGGNAAVVDWSAAGAGPPFIARLRGRGAREVAAG